LIYDKFVFNYPPAKTPMKIAPVIMRVWRRDQSLDNLSTWKTFPRCITEENYGNIHTSPFFTPTLNTVSKSLNIFAGMQAALFAHSQKRKELRKSHQK